MNLSSKKACSIGDGRTNCYSTVQNHSVLRGNKVAVCQRRPDGNYSLTTYKELSDKARVFAGLFHQLAPDAAIIPMFLGKSPDSIAAMLGAMGTNKTFSFLNPKLRTPQIVAVLESVESNLVLVDGPGLLSLEMMPSDRIVSGPFEWLILRGEHFSKLHERAADRLAAKASVRYVSDALQVLQKSCLSTNTENLDRPGCCLFTSGSTGNPKGVLISKADLIARAHAEIETYGLTETDVVLSILPFSFDVGLNQLLSTLVSGCELILLDSWLPADILNVTEERGVTGISGVPSIWLEMIKCDVRFLTYHQHHSLRYLTISGGSLPPRYLEQMPRLAENVAVFKTYGQTEAFRSTCLMPSDFNTKRLSVGQPFSGVHIYVVREDGSRCRPNEIGEVVHSGLGIMLGYIERDDPQDKLRLNPFYGEDDPSKYAVFTGDYGYLDEDGYLYLKGRRDALLKVSGNRVYPNEVASQMVAIEGVAEAEIIGIKRGEDDTLLVGFVVINDGYELEPMIVRRELSRRVPSYMVPSEILFLPSMPHTASGKTDYPRLQEAARCLLDTNR